MEFIVGLGLLFLKYLIETIKVYICKLFLTNRYVWDLKQKADKKYKHLTIYIFPDLYARYFTLINKTCLDLTNTLRTI